VSITTYIGVCVAVVEFEHMSCDHYLRYLGVKDD
jgi:hypothetical protein